MAEKVKYAVKVNIGYSAKLNLGTVARLNFKASVLRYIKVLRHQTANGNRAASLHPCLNRGFHSFHDQDAPARHLIRVFRVHVGKHMPQEKCLDA